MTAAWIFAVSVSACSSDDASVVSSGDQSSIASMPAAAPLTEQTTSLPPTSDPVTVTGAAIGDEIDSAVEPVLPRTRVDGTIDLEGMPAWTPVGLDDVVAGYVKTVDLFGPSSPPADGVIVYDELERPIGRLTADGVVLTGGS